MTCIISLMFIKDLRVIIQRFITLFISRHETSCFPKLVKRNKNPSLIHVSCSSPIPSHYPRELLRTVSFHPIVSISHLDIINVEKVNVRF